MNLNSKIGIGSVQFGLDYGISNTMGKTSLYEVKEILKTAHEDRIDTIDTASMYGDSEIILGSTGLTNSFKIVSKFMPSTTNGTIFNQFEKSCRKLKVNQLYAYISHRPSDLINNKKDWDQLNEIKKQGKVNKIGFSLNTTDELEKLLSMKIIPDLIQVPYNYFDSRFEYLMITLSESGCEIHTRSTFLQGLFFVDVNKLNIFFEEVKKPIELLQQTHKTLLSSVLLKYVLNKPFIDKVIIGIENTEQLKNNIIGIKNSKLIEKLNFKIPEKILIPSNWPKN
jgi:aryl-alcohol dehydrogenase-like predicted oxidoreductase